MGNAVSNCSSPTLEKCQKLETADLFGLADSEWLETARGLCTKVLGMDFDLTLTTEPIHASIDATWMHQMFGGQPRVDALREFMRLLRNRGVQIIIISWNASSIIKSALEAVGLLSFIDHIYDRSLLEQKGDRERSKALVMQEIILRLGGPASVRAVFVDSNAAQLSTIPCAKHCVEGKQGMTQADIKAVCKLLQM
mmetsp:Transcript_127753/g.238806  ORF Transcript_127753/g.238806 Transcript_127753/m.238806 type:complete len:196 (+) Transcript_127753:47-634(+)